MKLQEGSQYLSSDCTFLKSIGVC